MESMNGILDKFSSQRHLSLALFCSSPLPVWEDHEFTFCFEELVFGCAASLITIFLIVICSKRCSSIQEQKAKKAFQFFGMRRVRCVGMLPAISFLLTTWQGLRLIFSDHNEWMLHHSHTVLFICLHGLESVLSCWVLHYRYAAVMTKQRCLQIWWLLRPTFHIPYVYSLGRRYKVLWTPEVLEEVLDLLVSSLFGLSTFIIGFKVSSVISSKNRDLPDLSESLLDIKHSQIDLKSKKGISLWEQLLFTWVTPLMDLGIKRQLNYDDLFDLPESLDPNNCSKWLFKSWMEEQTDKECESSLFHAIYLVYRWQYLYIGIVKMLNDASGFAGPLLLHSIVTNMEDGQAQNAKIGYGCAIAIGLMSILRAFLGTQYTFMVAKLKLQLRSSIIMLIYYKALDVRLSDRNCFSNGEIQTLMSVDSERIVNLCGSLHELWSLPLQMMAALILLYLQVKFSFLAGLAVIVLLIPVNKVIATKIGLASQRMMKAKDERVRRMGEILTYIRTIKMYAWEGMLSNRVMESRKEEVKYLGVRKYLDALCVYFWATTPILFSFFTFGLYYLLGYELNAAIVFTSLSLFNMLISPLNSFPWVINGCIEAVISLKRLTRFLLTSKLSPEWVQLLEHRIELESTLKKNNVEIEEEYAICIQNGSFSWMNTSNEFQPEHLRSINMKIPKGTVVLVLGKVGSGKSSLLQAILGEMTQLEGQTILRGKPGYVSQNPWILSGTVRDNILFGKSYFKERYDRVLSACALDIDVERMVGKDLCIIGEQGFNLSGGQRSRIALARAIYHDCDILILDDPLSSLDAHVATWILDHAFSGTLLANKTIVLATYKVQALSMADMVIVLEDGVMTYCGKTEQFKEEFGNDYNRGESLTDHYISYYMKNGISEKIIEHGGEICSSHPVEEINSHLIENPVPLVEEEGRVQGAVQAIVYWTYATFMGRRLLFLIFASTALMQMSRNGSDFWLSVWVDRSSWKAINGGQFFLVVFICLAAANSVFTAARAFSFAYGGISAAFQVHESLLKRVIEAPIKFFESNPKGRILNRFSSDQYAVDDSLPFISNILLANSFSLLGIIVILCIVQWTFLVILFPLGYIYIGLQKYYRCTSRELRRLDSTSRSPIYNSFNDALDGSTTIRAFQVQSMFCRKNASDITLNQRSSFSEIAASIWLSIRLQLLAACIIFFISTMSIWSHGVRTPIGHTTSGLVGLALSYATPIISLLSDLLSTFTETEKEMVSVERINEYMDAESEENKAVSRQADLQWPSTGLIEFFNVSLSYGPALPPALKNLSIKLPGGWQIDEEIRPILLLHFLKMTKGTQCKRGSKSEFINILERTFQVIEYFDAEFYLRQPPRPHKVGIAGRTGAGKSSILNVLFRLTEPTAGCIKIDGVDISKVSLYELRSKLAVVPQTPFLFEGTVRENIDIHGDVTDHRIWEILDKCHLKDTILSLGGLDANIREGGESLSLGQRQLLCLSRAFARATKVLCLDECTANIDPHTSWILQRAIASECKGKTVMVIAHRVQSIMNLDHVLILENGELAEEGNPRVLLQNQFSKFSSLVHASGE